MLSENTCQYIGDDTGSDSDQYQVCASHTPFIAGMMR